jgi:hypothetical protein
MEIAFLVLSLLVLLSNNYIPSQDSCQENGLQTSRIKYKLII